MLLQIVSQALLVPLVLSLLIVFAGKSVIPVRQNLLYIILLAWLLVYIWIVRIPNFPPRLTSDYLGPLVLFLIVADRLLSLNVYRQIIVRSIFMLSAILMSWTVLSYEAKLSTHWKLWLEFALFSMLVCFQPFSLSQSHSHARGFLYAMVIGVSGVLIIASGSMLLGLLSASLASVVIVPMIISSLSFNTSALNLVQLLGLSILLIARYYSEFSLIAFIAIVSSFLLINMLRFDRRRDFGLIGSTLTMAIFALVYEELLQKSTYY